MAEKRQRALVVNDTPAGRRGQVGSSQEEDPG
jgi:hypothetical protein